MKGNEWKRRIKTLPSPPPINFRENKVKVKVKINTKTNNFTKK